MNLETYQANKRLRAEAQAAECARQLCVRCRRAMPTCTCAVIQPFRPAARFVILIHPKENRKRVGTGRLAHLCLENSALLCGVDFTHDPELWRILRDPAVFPVLLYPGPDALDITTNAASTLEALVPEGRELVVVVLDGSWSCAKKMLRVCAPLRALPRIAFVPSGRSRYAIRRQPSLHCFSTIEAVHFIITELGRGRRWPAPRGHETLLGAFELLVARQLSRVTRPGQRATRGKR